MVANSRKYIKSGIKSSNKLSGAVRLPLGMITTSEFSVWNKENEDKTSYGNVNYFSKAKLLY